ncbi:ribonuclease P [Halobacteriales archaeon SW_7_71_33]|nr:MAG: ribonuclease P [Halobacteriales archaeon SW_7_71_33]
MITAATLPRHELNGLSVRVVDADDPGRAGIEGRVAVETTKTLHVEGRDGRVRQVPKRGTTLEFAVRESDPSVAPGREPAGVDDESDDGDAERVLVDGSRLVARPARRTERGGDSRWR